MDEWLEAIHQLPNETKEYIDRQYQSFVSMHPNGYIIGIDLSGKPDQTGWIYNGA